MAAESKSDLKNYFETGDIPTEAQFANFIDSTFNTVDNNLLEGRDIGIEPTLAGTQSTAYQITKRINLITVDPGGTAAIKLPQGKSGMVAWIGNGLEQEFTVYPFLGDVITTGATNAPARIPALSILVCICLSDTAWTIVPFDLNAGRSDMTGFESDIEDVSPSNQGTAFPLTRKYNTVATTHVTKGAVVLPAAVPGRELFLVNSGANASDVYPAAGQQILIVGITNNPYQFDPGEQLHFVCNQSGFWSVFLT